MISVFEPLLSGVGNNVVINESTHGDALVKRNKITGKKTSIGKIKQRAQPESSLSL